MKKMIGQALLLPMLLVASCNSFAQDGLSCADPRMTMLQVAACNDDAQDLKNIENYCSDMANANKAGAVWYDRCVATREVQRKYEKQAEKKKEEAVKMQVFKTRVEWILGISSLQREIKKSKNSDEIQRLEKSTEPFFANNCQGFFPNPSDCERMKKEVLTQ
ncbi:MAG: hypothetical protein Q7K13_02435 [Polynucleobacter sp.]|uniref:hypothetical protein n=1 Tax=Polynucleobacter sp. TaxID=2029855 RepID=UPI00271E2558|nr:hypothetical protein [Polynucleobacter sp.]MDO8713322.1 hypothetical protein [Polynucleobacter sp.]